MDSWWLGALPYGMLPTKTTRDGGFEDIALEYLLRVEAAMCLLDSLYRTPYFVDGS